MTAPATCATETFDRTLARHRHFCRCRRSLIAFPAVLARGFRPPGPKTRNISAQDAPGRVFRGWVVGGGPYLSARHLIRLGISGFVGLHHHFCRIMASEGRASNDRGRCRSGRVGVHRRAIVVQHRAATVFSVNPRFCAPRLVPPRNSSSSCLAALPPLMIAGWSLRVIAFRLFCRPANYQLFTARPALSVSSALRPRRVRFGAVD